MTRLSFLLLALAAMTAGGANGPLVTRVYPALIEESCPSSSCVWSKDAESQWKAFYGEFGVEWPEGSYIRYLPTLGGLAVRNTEENHVLFRETFERFLSPPVLVRTQIHFCAFTPEAFEALGLFETVGTTLDSDAWKELRKRIVGTEGADILGCPATLSAQGTPSTVKAVTEHVYPSEFGVEPLESAANGTNAPAWRATVAVEPRSFTCREVGQIVQLRPTVLADRSRIWLDLTPSIVFPPTWRDFGSSHPSDTADSAGTKMEQPFFPSADCATSLELRPGDTVALGGAALDEPGARRRFYVFFVTASLLETESEPVSAP